MLMLASGAFFTTAAPGGKPNRASHHEAEGSSAVAGLAGPDKGGALPFREGIKFDGLIAASCVLRALVSHLSVELAESVSGPGCIENLRANAKEVWGTRTTGVPGQQSTGAAKQALGQQSTGAHRSRGQRSTGVRAIWKPCAALVTKLRPRQRRLQAQSAIEIEADAWVARLLGRSALDQSIHCRAHIGLSF
jgi:hypothetical protein